MSPKDKKSGSFLRTTAGQMIIVAVVVALLGELKLYPFASTFRFGLGAPAFAFALLFFSRLPLLWSSIVTGLAVVIFRSYLTIVFEYKEIPMIQGSMEGHLWTDLFALHGATGMFYIGMAFCFYIFKIRKYVHRPFFLVLLLSVADIGGNLAEILFRMGNLLDPRVFSSIVLVGVLRSLMLTGLYLSLKWQEDEIRREGQRKKYEELLLLLTDLNTEAFLLRKSSSEIEAVMRRSYEIYKNLEGYGKHAQAALDIARDVHEIKKDYQRIMAGLDRILKEKKLEAGMHFSDIVDVVTRANHSYARQLQKEIEFNVRLEYDFTTDRYYDWASVLNNLVENAVEATGIMGSIEISAKLLEDSFVLDISDKGMGIPDQDWETVFYTGYSTKSDPVSGKFSTGLGLTQARALTAELGGTIGISASNEKGTTFRLVFPSGVEAGQAAGF